MKKATIFTGLLLLMCGAAFVFLLVSPLPAAISLRTNPLFFYPAAALLAALVALNLLLIFRHSRGSKKSVQQPLFDENTAARIATEFTKNYRDKS